MVSNIIWSGRGPNPLPDLLYPYDMAKQGQARSISTYEVALRIKDELNDFHIDDLISSQVHEKKTRFINVLRAINHADRIVTRDMNLSGVIVLFVPAETHNIIFAQNKRYANEYFNSIQAQQADLISEDSNYFLGRDQYLDIIAILDRFLYIYDRYPTGAEKVEARIKKKSVEDYRGIENELSRIENSTYIASPYYEDSREADSYCYFIPDEGRLVLQEKFKSPKFLSFTARLMPGLIRLADVKEEDRDSNEYDMYNIKTPHWGMELLIYEALEWLLPLSASDARALVKQQKLEQKEGFESKKPGDSNVITPHFSWG